MAKYLFGDIVKEIKEKVDRSNNPYECYIAGEHMDTDELHLLRRGCFEGSDVGPAFIRIFKPGQILYGSRRTYLRKVAVADFEGVTANTTFVLESKDESVLLQRLLPFIMQSDRFVQHSIKRSKGSTNPYVLFSDLADYEVELPSIEKQKELADLLWAMDSVKMSYKKLIAATDELVKSRFIEMFGDPVENPFHYPCVLLSNVSDIMSGITKGRKPKSTELTSVPYVCTANVQNGFIDWSETKYIEATADEITKYALIEDDILMIEGGDADKVGRGCMAGKLPEACIYQNHVFRVRVNKALIEPAFLASYILLPSTKAYFLWCAKQTTGIATINKKQLGELHVMYPPLEEQKQYLQIVQQSDKSKYHTSKAMRTKVNSFVKTNFFYF